MAARVTVVDQYLDDEPAILSDRRAHVERSRIEVTDHDGQPHEVHENGDRTGRLMRRRNLVPSMVYKGLDDAGRSGASKMGWQTERWGNFMERESDVRGQGLPFQKDKTYGRIYRPTHDKEAIGLPYFEDFDGTKYYPLPSTTSEPLEVNGYVTRRRNMETQIRSWDEFELASRNLGDSGKTETRESGERVAEDRSASRFSLQSNGSNQTQDGNSRDQADADDKSIKSAKQATATGQIGEGLESLTKEKILENIKNVDVSGRYFDISKYRD